jgi:hypothetical protein
MTGQFKVKFSNAIQTLKLEALRVKRPMEISVVWMENELTAYSVQFMEATEFYISAQIVFNDTTIVSRGLKSDLL